MTGTRVGIVVAYVAAVILAVAGAGPAIGGLVAVVGGAFALLAFAVTGGTDTPAGVPWRRRRRASARRLALRHAGPLRFAPPPGEPLDFPGRAAVRTAR